MIGVPNVMSLQFLEGSYFWKQVFDFSGHSEHLSLFVKQV